MDPIATIADARHPNSLSHTFGTIGNNSDVAFNGPGTYSPGISSGTQVASITPFGNLPQPAQKAPNIVASAAATTISDSGPSLWEKGTGWIKANTGVDVDQKIADAKQAVDDVKQTSGWKFAQEHPKLAAFGLRMMMAPGGNANSQFGNPQDRSFRVPPAPVPFEQPQMSQQPVSPLQTLNNLMANMVAKGATPEQIAYVQNLINQLSNSQVA